MRDAVRVQSAMLESNAFERPGRHGRLAWMTRTVSLPATTVDTLEELAHASGRSVQQIVGEAVEQYRRAIFLADLHQDFVALRQNEDSWRHELEERTAWDVTLDDCLDSDLDGSRS